MNKYFGGEQHEMRKSKIELKSYLNPFDHCQKLKVSDTQDMQHQPLDTGPFYLSDEMKEELKYDVQLVENETKKFTRSQLIDNLKHTIQFTKYPWHT